MPNSGLGGLSPAALKFGTLDFPHFNLPKPLTPGHKYCDFIARSITNQSQVSLQNKRQALSPVINSYQGGDLILWNPKENSHSFRWSKLAPKLFDPYQLVSQHKNDVLCIHPVAQTSHILQSSRLMPFIGSVDSAKPRGPLDSEEYIVDHITPHRGKRLSF